MCRTSTIPLSLCSDPIGRCTATHRDENCSWICASVRKKSARSRSSMLTKRTRARPRSSARCLTRAVPDLETHHRVDDDERALDDAQRTARLALEARVARDVEEVDLAPLPARMRERQRDRHLPLLLVLVPVADGGTERRSSQAARSRRSGTAAPRQATSCRCHDGRRRRRCGSFRARVRPLASVPPRDVWCDRV